MRLSVLDAELLRWRLRNLWAGVGNWCIEQAGGSRDIF